MLMSVGSSTSSMPVIELTVVPPSLIESAATCECASMMPGVTKRPLASTTSAPAGMSVPGPPTAAIFPSRRITVPFWMVPRVTVSTVPPRMATTDGRDACAIGRPSCVVHDGGDDADCEEKLLHEDPFY